MWSSCFLLLFQGTAIEADQDVFRITREGNPREDAFERELASWVNVSGAWQRQLRVVATMTTTPRRINFIEPALDGLLQQSQPLDAVYLFVPKVFKRENTTYQIPKWLSALQQVAPTLQLRRCEDWGPATHLLEVLKAERDPETAILQVDDDQRYGPLLLESLLRAMGPAPGRAIGAATQHAHTHLGGAVLEGVHGVLFRRKFFDDEIFNFENFSPHCRLHDDLWISAHLARKGILREVLISRLGTKALSYGFGEDALYMGGAGSDNSKNFFLCSASLLRACPKLWAPQTRVALVVGAKHWTLQGFRRLGGVVQAAYVYGKVDPVMPHSTLDVPRGRRFSVGPWHQPVEVFLGAKSLAEALEVALNFEEDASSVIVFFSDVPSKGLKKMVKDLVRCVTSLKPHQSRQSCRHANGVAFWRHAAYPADRIGGAIFLPKYSEDFHAYQRGLWWRDLTGDWHVFAATQRERFELLQMHGREDATVQNWFAASLSMHRRVVAILSVVLAPKVVLPQLFHPPKAWRNYIAVKAHRRTRRHAACVPRVSAMRFRRRILCLTEALHPLDGLLNLERWPKTLIVLTGRRRPPLESLLQATDLWAGAVIAQHAYAYGKHAGPIPDSFDGSILYRRSFLDARFLEDLKRPECAKHPDLVLAAHVALKSIPTEVLGAGRLLSNRLQVGATDCWARLVQHRSLWSSVSPQRSVLHVALLDGTDPFLLDLTLRYAATQSNKPDEIVLLTAGQRLLEESQMPHPLEEMGHVEVHLPKESWMQVQVKSRGKALPVELHKLLGSLKDKAGCVLYAKGRSLVLSVVSCTGAACGPRSGLALHQI